LFCLYKKLYEIPSRPRKSAKKTDPGGGKLRPACTKIDTGATSIEDKSPITRPFIPVANFLYTFAPTNDYPIDFTLHVEGANFLYDTPEQVNRRKACWVKRRVFSSPNVPSGHSVGSKL
jgi:hypothetical protein